MIYESALISIVIQFITALVDTYGITIPIQDSYSIIKDILKIELGVQIIELIFYIWLVFSIHSIKNITLYRYADWFITTPVMLLTLMAYLQIDPERFQTIGDFWKDHHINIIIVMILNAIMLAFGFLSELYPGYQILLVLLGCIPFVGYFYHIYKEYLTLKRPDIHPIFTRSRLFWYFVVVWSLYGVSAFFPYVLKNTSFNILDLFSKNAFGIMLVYILSHHSVGFQF
jgi:bacteriorhodopsin